MAQPVGKFGREEVQAAYRAECWAFARTGIYTLAACAMLTALGAYRWAVGGIIVELIGIPYCIWRLALSRDERLRRIEAGDQPAVHTNG